MTGNILAKKKKKKKEMLKSTAYSKYLPFCLQKHEPN